LLPVVNDGYTVSLLLTLAVFDRLLQVNQSGGLVVFISAPESTSWIAFAEPGMRLRHLLGTVGFEHGLSGLDGVFLRDVDREVHVTSAEAEVAEFKPEVFEISERLGAGVDMGLFLEAVVVAFGFEHHGDPVVSGVMR
jgi:hypothetical protein